MCLTMREYGISLMFMECSLPHSVDNISAKGSGT